MTLGLTDIWLAPSGDLALWLDGTQLRAMHLCDRQAVTLATVTSSPGGVQSITWSGDRRFASFWFGLTDDLTGPERVVVVDLQRGAIAEVERPWGFIRQWSPDRRFVVLGRRGFHDWVSTLARFEFK